MDRRRRWIACLVAGCLLAPAIAAQQKPSSAKSMREARAKAERDAREQMMAQQDAMFGPKNGKPVTLENAANQIRFQAPADWKPHPGGCPGSFFNLIIRPDFDAMPKAKPGETVKFYGDIFTVAANPLKTPDVNLDTAAGDVKSEITKGYPKAEFKPVEKSKVAGLEARVVTATMPAKDADEPKKTERHVVLIRGDKVYDLILYSHVNTVAKQTKQVDAIVKSIEWTGEPTPVAKPEAAPAAPVPSAAPAPQKPTAAPTPTQTPATTEGDGLE